MLLLGEERRHCVFIPRSCPLGSALCSHLSPVVWSHEVHCCGHCTVSALGILAVISDVAQALCSQIQQCRSTGTNLLKPSPGTQHSCRELSTWNCPGSHGVDPDLSPSSACTGPHHRAATPEPPSPVICLDILQG